MLSYFLINKNHPISAIIILKGTIMKIGLALSGGGTLGAAHVGALKEIDKQNINIDIISGTSAGAIIGVLYASGGTDAIDGFFHDLRNSNIFHTHKLIKITPAKIFEEIRLLLNKYVNCTSFSKLKIEFTCVATNIKTGEMTIFDKGNPVDCVMASAAYPGFFPAQKINKHLYIDGGVTRNFPVDILKKYNPNFIIGSSIYGIKKFTGNEKLSLIFSARRALEIMEKEASDHQEKLCDFCFKPPVENFNWYELQKLDQIIQIGNSYAINHINQLTQILPIKKMPDQLVRQTN